MFEELVAGRGRVRNLKYCIMMSSSYIDAQDIRRKNPDLDDSAVADTLYNMGCTLVENILNQNDTTGGSNNHDEELNQAYVWLEESLKIRQSSSELANHDSKVVGDTLNMMGRIKGHRWELDDAIGLLKDALRIRHHIYSTSSPEDKEYDDHRHSCADKVSETLAIMGKVYGKKNEFDLALESYQECLRIRRSELGGPNDDEAKIVDALVAMGQVQSYMEHHDDARQSFREALKIRTRNFGENDQVVANVFQSIGAMEFRAQNFEEALNPLTECIRIWRENDTTKNGDFVNVLCMIANIHEILGRVDEAQLCWSESYQLFQELGLAETNPQIAQAMRERMNLNHPEQNKEGGSFFGKMMEKLFFKGNHKENTAGSNDHRVAGVR